jgi:hypothetical protein
VLVAVGLRGLVQLKTWGVLALGAAGALTLTMVGGDIATYGLGPTAMSPGMLGGGMLVAAVAPFLAPIARFVTGR